MEFIVYSSQLSYFLVQLFIDSTQTSTRKCSMKKKKGVDGPVISTRPVMFNSLFSPINSSIVIFLLLFRCF